MNELSEVICHTMCSGQKLSAVSAGRVFAFDAASGRFRLQQGHAFHLVVSHLPCGDACITGTDARSANLSQGVAYEQPAAACACGHAQRSVARASNVSSRTGAKPITAHADGCRSSELHAASASSLQSLQRGTGATMVPANADVALTPPPATDAQAQAFASQPTFDSTRTAQGVPGAADVEAGPQRPGCLRRKPGRGAATLSMSCSDKIGRWGLLGWQGALPATLLDAPLRFASISVLGDAGADWSAAAAVAALPSVQAHGTAHPLNTDVSAATASATCETHSPVRPSGACDGAVEAAVTRAVHQRFEIARLGAMAALAANEHSSSVQSHATSATAAPSYSCSDRLQAQSDRVTSLAHAWLATSSAPQVRLFTARILFVIG